MWDQAFRSCDDDAPTAIDNSVDELPNEWVRDGEGPRTEIATDDTHGEVTKSSIDIRTPDRLLNEVADFRLALLDTFVRPTNSLDREFINGYSLLIERGSNLAALDFLTAQADDDSPGDIRVLTDSHERSSGLFIVRAELGTAVIMRGAHCFRDLGSDPISNKM
jgi:hypothetical protein